MKIGVGVGTTRYYVGSKVMYRVYVEDKSSGTRFCSFVMGAEQYADFVHGIYVNKVDADVHGLAHVGRVKETLKLRIPMGLATKNRVCGSDDDFVTWWVENVTEHEKDGWFAETQVNFKYLNYKGLDGTYLIELYRWKLDHANVIEEKTTTEWTPEPRTFPANGLPMNIDEACKEALEERCNETTCIASQE